MPDVVAVTARLRLRTFEPGDAAAIAPIYGDPDVMRYVGRGPVAEPAAVQRMVDEYAGHQRQHGWSVWAVEETVTGELIGDAGLWPNGDEVELGYTLARGAWGRGYATEAARACVEVAARLRIPALIALTDPANTASQHVLEKLGMQRTGTRTAYGREHAAFRLEPPA